MKATWQIFLALATAVLIFDICTLNHLEKEDHNVPNLEKPVSTANPLPKALAPDMLSTDTNIKSISTCDDTTKNVDLQDVPEPKRGPEIERARIQEEKLGVLRDWARQQPEAALEWALQQPDGPQRHEVVVDVCYLVAQSDPATAVSFAQQLHLDQGPGAVMENLIQQWAGEDASAAYAWVQVQPLGEERDRLMMRIALIWSQTDPANAAQMVARQIAAGAIQNEAAMTVLHQWALRDMQGAIAWAQLYPAGALHDRAINELNGIMQISTAE